MPAIDSTFVLLPRFTTLAGATSFTTLPMDVSAFGGAQFQVWRGQFRTKDDSIAKSFKIYLEESLDTQTWVLGPDTPAAITIAEGWGAKHADWERLVRVSGYAAMAREEGVPLVAMDDDGTFDVEGDTPGKPLLLRGMERTDVERGQVIAKPGSITPHTHFEAEVYILSKDEGGRHTPFFSGYRPQFYFRTTDVTGAVELDGGAEMVMPGDNIKMTVELIAPIAMDAGLRFAIREGGKTVGAGVVAKIIK